MRYVIGGDLIIEEGWVRLKELKKHCYYISPDTYFNLIRGIIETGEKNGDMVKVKRIKPVEIENMADLKKVLGLDY